MTASRSLLARRWVRWSLPIIAVIGVVIVVGALVPDRSGERSSESTQPTVTVTVPPIAPTVSITVTMPPPPPKVIFSDGLFLVGKDVAPGEYQSDKPTGTMCYWARLRSTDSTDIITNNLTEGPSRLTAIAGEYLQVNGCSFHVG